jgi:hypothetical protein
MVLNMNKAILLVFLISVSQMAVAQDRTAVLPTLEKLCENDLLGSPHDLAALSVLRINLPDFCGCMSSQMIAHFSSAQVAAYSKSSQLPPNFNDLWQGAGQFCKAVLALVI